MASKEQPVTEKKLWDLIHDIRFAMLTTQGPGGELQSHPLTTQNRADDEESELWFFISSQSSIAHTVLQHDQVNLAYANPDDDRYVSISGTARLVDDPAKKQELWSTFSQAWFPKGVNDPDLTLMCVHISQAEYWDVKSSKMVQFFAMAKAALTGQRPGPVGAHGQLNPH